MPRRKPLSRVKTENEALLEQFSEVVGRCNIPFPNEGERNARRLNNWLKKIRANDARGMYQELE